MFPENTLHLLVPPGLEEDHNCIQVVLLFLMHFPQQVEGLQFFVLSLDVVQDILLLLIIDGMHVTILEESGKVQDFGVNFAHLLFLILVRLQVVQGLFVVLLLVEMLSEFLLNVSGLFSVLKYLHSMDVEVVGGNQL